MFENLKKRYSKKKVDFKKSNQSGTSTAIVEKAKKALEEYRFLSWLDEHVSGRQTLSNPPESSNSYESELIQKRDDVQTHRIEDCDARRDNSDSEMDENDEGSVPDHTPTEHTKPDTVTPPTINNVNKVTRKFSGKEPKQKKARAEVSAVEKFILQELKDEKTEEKGPEDLFGMTIAAELKLLDQRTRYIAKNEIRNVLFRYQMGQFSHETPSRLPQSSFFPNRSHVRSQDSYLYGFTSPDGSHNSNMSYTELLESTNS